MGKVAISTAILALAVASSSAGSVEYITDLPLFSSLAPCAQSALENNVQAQTRDKCPEAVTDLQSCICTKNNNLASISSKISASISYSCGSTASDDHASASTVLSVYCDTNAAAAFPTPTAVSAYITEIPEFDYLAPCAKSAVRYAVGSMTYSNCPSDAPMLASCACHKNQNSRVVSQLINSSVKYSCNGHTADITSAQAMFSAYCAMDAGTTAFPTPSNPPGDMTYFITDLPQYSALAPCAAYGVSYGVFSQTYDFCPGGPQALASCVCLKEGMPSEVSKVISSSVKYSCSSTATEDVSSAIAVYNYYCSAAKAQVTADGVSNSVEQSSPASRDSDGPQATGGSGSGNGNGSGGGGGSGNGNGSGNSDGSGTGGSTQNGDTSTSSSPNIAVIVGAVVGVVVGLALIGALVFFLVKSAKKRKAMEQLQSPDNSPSQAPAGPYNGMQELPNTAASGALPPPSPSPSNIPGRIDNVSPASAHTGAFAPPPHNQAELHGQAALYPPMPNRPELHSQHTGTPPPPVSPNTSELYGHGTPPPPMNHGQYAPVSPNASELYGQGTPPPNRPELQGQGAMYPPPVPPSGASELAGQGSQFHNANMGRPELAGQYGYPQQQAPPGPAPSSWQSGPVQGYHEMDGGHGGQGR